MNSFYFCVPPSTFCDCKQCTNCRGVDIEGLVKTCGGGSPQAGSKGSKAPPLQIYVAWAHPVLYGRCI